MGAGNLDTSYPDAPIDSQPCIKAHNEVVTVPSSTQDRQPHHLVDRRDNITAPHHLCSLLHLGPTMATCKDIRADTTPALIIAAIWHTHEIIIVITDIQRSPSSPATNADPTTQWNARAVSEDTISTFRDKNK